MRVSLFVHNTSPELEILTGSTIRGLKNINMFCYQSLTLDTHRHLYLLPDAQNGQYNIEL